MIDYGVLATDIGVIAGILWTAYQEARYQIQKAIQNNIIRHISSNAIINSTPKQ